MRAYDGKGSGQWALVYEPLDGEREMIVSLVSLREAEKAAAKHAFERGRTTDE